MMHPFRKKQPLLSHSLAFVIAIVITVISEQNPRVLLYANAISLLFRFLSVWSLSNLQNSPNYSSELPARLSRTPKEGEKSRPYREQKTRKMAGIGSYTVGILTVIFMLGILFQMASGHGFLDTDTLIPELVWATVIAFVYWVDDLASQKIVLAPGKSTPVNLGYNVSGLNFLLAAIFISAFILLILMSVVAMFFDHWPTDLAIIFEWIIFLIFSLVRFVSDIFDNTRKKKLP